MIYDSRQLRAIAYCAKKYNQTIGISPWPYVYFYSQPNGEELRLAIDDVCMIYDEGRKEDQKEARRRKLTERPVK